MTLDEFDSRKWVNGMTCMHDGRYRKIASVDFQEKLIGLKNMDETDMVDWVRCENVTAVADPL